MSKPRFQLYAEVDTLAHATTIKTSIQNQLAGKDIFDELNFSVLNSSDNLIGKVLILADWRFNSAVDRDSLKNWAQDQIQNQAQVKVWVQSAKVSWHTCTHDDANVQLCSSTNYFEWNK